MKTAAGSKPARRPFSQRPWWPHARRVLIGAFFALAAYLLYENAKDIEWAQVGTALRGYAPATLALAALVALCSHAIYSSFDLIGKRWSGHTLPARKVVPVTFVCYAFNLNLGSLVGGFAFRYRLYARLGLDNETITRVLAASLVTNWLGYLVLAGGVFALGIVTPPEGWKIGATALRVLGVALLAVAAGYVAACGIWRSRSWTLRGHRFELPPLRLALLQLVLSTTNWALIAGVVWVLLGQKIEYPMVLGALLVAAVAGVVAHIPAGLGVLEAVFVALLGGAVARHDLLAALIAYRAIYYLVPLAIALVVYLKLEAGASAAKKDGAANREPSPRVQLGARRAATRAAQPALAPSTAPERGRG